MRLFDYGKPGRTLVKKLFEVVDGELLWRDLPATRKGHSRRAGNANGLIRSNLFSGVLRTRDIAYYLLTLEVPTHFVGFRGVGDPHRPYTEENLVHYNASKRLFRYGVSHPTSVDHERVLWCSYLGAWAVLPQQKADKPRVIFDPRTHYFDEADALNAVDLPVHRPKGFDMAGWVAEQTRLTHRYVIDAQGKKHQMQKLYAPVL